jgi:hypothetical protein
MLCASTHDVEIKECVALVLNSSFAGWDSTGNIEREMCLWAISKYFGDLVSNTSA